MADVRSEHASDSPANDAPAGPSGHPLFPRAENETGPDLRRIDLIHIERIKEDGTWEACPRVFKTHELQSWKDIVDMFGGGVYRARAQCKKTYQWQGMTERKEFNGPPSRPFCEEAPKAKPTAPQPASVEAAPPPHAAFPHGPPPGWMPPAWTPPPGWAPPPGWTGMQPSAPSPAEPPAWIALLLKALDRPQAPANDASLFAVMFKAQTEQNAVMLKAQADRDAMLLKLLVDRPATATGVANPLEMIREIAPLLKNNTAPGQFMQGVEVAKSLLQQAAPAPAQEDFASTLANIMRTLSPQGLTGFPGMDSAPSAPAAPAASAPAQTAAPAAPVLNLDDVIRMAASDRNLAQRFIEEMRRQAQKASEAASPPVPTPAPAPAGPVHTASAPAPVGPVHTASAPAPSPPPAPAYEAAPANAPPAPTPRPTSSPANRSTSSPAAAPGSLDRPRRGPTAPPPANDVIGSVLAAAQDEPDEPDELAFSFATLGGMPEMQEMLSAAGEEGRRALLLNLTRQSSPDAAPAAPTGKGPPST